MYVTCKNRAQSDRQSRHYIFDIMKVFSSARLHLVCLRKIKVFSFISFCLYIVHLRYKDVTQQRFIFFTLQWVFLGMELFSLYGFYCCTEKWRNRGTVKYSHFFQYIALRSEKFAQFSNQ